MLTTEKNVISAIEDWVDMSPDLREQANLAQKISKENDKSNKLLIQKKGIEEKLNIKGAKVDELQKQIYEKDEELKSVHTKISKLKAQQTYVLGQPLFDTSSSYLSLNGSLQPSKICEVCKTQYICDIPSAVGLDRCSKCKNIIHLTTPGVMLN